MITTKDIAWAAGFLEGEGCFSFSNGPKSRPTPNVRAPQVNKEPLLRLQNIFHMGNIYSQERSKYNGQTIHRWAVYGQDAIQVMETILVLMSEKRRNTIIDIINRWKKVPMANKNKTHCPMGHAYDKENTYQTKHGGRICRACHRVYNKRLKEIKE